MPKAREGGESTRGGIIPPLVRGFWGSTPIYIVFNFERFYVRFNVFYAFGNRFQSRFFA